jgi:uncharacterized protein YndB with AHSA1/START domain
MKKLTLERSLHAPIEKVWEALTDANKLKKWWSPADFNTADISVDLKEGGIFKYCFKNSEGQEFWGRGVYQTIEVPKFLSWLDTFADAKGNPVPPSYYGMPGDAIVEAMVEFSLTANGDMTNMKMIGDDPHDDSMLEDMKKGWNGMFDKLETLLEKDA